MFVRFRASGACRADRGEASVCISEDAPNAARFNGPNRRRSGPYDRRIALAARKAVDTFRGAREMQDGFAQAALRGEADADGESVGLIHLVVDRSGVHYRKGPPPEAALKNAHGTEVPTQEPKTPLVESGMAKPTRRSRLHNGAKIVIVCSDKGGVGKDLIAQGVGIAAMRQLRFGTFIEVEVAPRLTRLYPEGKFIKAAAASIADIYDSPDIVMAPMDALADACLAAKDVSVVSLGANLTTAFQVWSQTNGAEMFGDGEDTIYVVVLTMNNDSLAAGLANLHELGRLYPAAKRVAILNCVHGNFFVGEENLAARLMEAQGGGLPIDTVLVPKMSAPGWGQMATCGSLLDIANLRPADLVGMGVPEGQAIRSLGIYPPWLNGGLVGPLAQGVLPDVFG